MLSLNHPFFVFRFFIVEYINILDWVCQGVDGKFLISIPFVCIYIITHRIGFVNSILKFIFSINQSSIVLIHISMLPEM